MEAVVKEFRDRVPIVHVKAPGFKGNSYQGYELFFVALAEQLLKPQPVRPHTINIFGVVPYQHLFWKGNLTVVKELFAKVGVEANIFFTEFQGLDNLQQIPAAALNVVLSPWNGHLATAALQEKFGTPVLTFPNVPVGPKQSTALLRAVAQALNLDVQRVEQVTAAEERSAYRYAEYFGDALILGFPHAYFAVVADTGTAIGITQYLNNDVAYIPAVVILTDDPPPEARPEIVRALTDGLDGTLKPEVIFEIDAYKIRQRLKDHHFAFLLASSLEKNIAGEEYGAIHHSIAFPSFDRLVLDRSYAGYRGGLALMEELTSKWVGPL